MFKSSIRPAASVFVMLTFLAGAVYPLLVTGIGAAVFPAQAVGSLIVENGRVIGSALIGQNFSDPKYFWGRPSATGTMPYNPLASGGSNQGPLNPALIDAIKARIETLRAADPGNTAAVPVDLVTASASGLDPHISIAAAEFQAARIARLRGLPPEQVRKLIEDHSSGRWLGIFGEPRVHVLQLNLALDSTTAERAS
jgi:potassium-transporting ATPase KdpC subunit